MLFFSVDPEEMGTCFGFLVSHRLPPVLFLFSMFFWFCVLGRLSLLSSIPILYPPRLLSFHGRAAASLVILRR